MDERACRRKNLENGTHVMYSKTENGSEDTLLQGIIEYIEGEQDFAEHGHKARFTNGDIGFVKEILDVDSIDSEHIINLLKLNENQKLEFKNNTSYLSLNDSIKVKVVDNKEKYTLSKKDGLYFPANTQFFLENTNNCNAEIIFCEGL